MEEKKVKKLFILNIIMMTFSTIISVYAASYLFESEQVSYDNTSSGLTSTNVQDSLDELYNHATDYTSMDTRVSALEDHFQNNTTSKFQGNMLNINSTNSGNRGLEIRDASNLERAYFYYSPSNERVILSTNGQGPLYIQGNPVMINGADVSNIASRVSTLESNDYQIIWFRTDSDTINGGQHKDIIADIPSGTIPSGKTISVAYIMTTPNSAWVFANITSYTSTQVRIGAYNTYTSALTGTYLIVLFVH